ncbi:hypothetical protein WME94_19680 [Sorangium sp. So ce429]
MSSSSRGPLISCSAFSISFGLAARDSASREANSSARAMSGSSCAGFTGIFGRCSRTACTCSFVPSTAATPRFTLTSTSRGSARHTCTSEDGMSAAMRWYCLYRAW